MNFGKLRLGIKISLIFLFLLSNPYTSFSQVIKINNLTVSHPLNYFPKKKINQIKYSVTPDTLYVYAIRVQFKQYNDPNTTGDGRFDLSNHYPDSIDAPPHDSTYFLDHLEFMRNYFEKSSKGKLIIKYRMLGNVRNLPDNMASYSPVGNEGFNKLGTLFFQAWSSVDSIDNVFDGINPSKSAFVIFHAGVGRDVDLISQGIFQGQLDIPSIYLSNSSLKNIYGDTTQGYYTRAGIVIPSSLIIPEQESRIINTSFGASYLELGMNGILAASLGSHLGLPDLFNTQTGITAIGRFGLMDGQSIFSYSGVFPPEPSAWEKQYLGWVNPIVINSPGTYRTLAASLDVNGNSSVYKVLIDAKEYFLVENRFRDAYKNGETVYYKKNGILDSMPFSSDQDGFQNGDVWKLKGDIVNVDELDWSLPGLKDDTANFQGGILIWHIDENVIDANFASNTINTNIYHRGVDLEEAKGSQDIGVEISTPFGVFVGDGTPWDYWYNGNHYVPSNIYRNEFTPTSFPNSKSYSNFNSRVCLSNFSTMDSSMTFNYAECGTISNINTFPRYVGVDTSVNAQPIGIDYNGNGFDEIFANVKDSLYGFRDNGAPIRVDAPNGFLKDSVSNYAVGFLNYQIGSQNKFITGINGNKVNLLSFVIDSLTTTPNVLTANSNTIFSTPSLYGVLGSSNILYSGTVDGKIGRLDLNNLTFGYDSVSDKRINELATGRYGHYVYVDDNYKYITLGKLNGGTSVVDDTVIVTKDNKLLVNHKLISGNLGISQIYSSPIVCDINGDGNQEIIFTADDKVFAVNQYGVLVDNFPFKVTGLNKISSGCAVADINNDGIYDVIFGTGDGRVYAYGSNGKVVDGFPLLTGKEVKSTPAIINYQGNFGLVVYSTDGYLYGWKLPTAYDSTKILWRNYLTDKYHRNSFFLNSPAPPLSGPCLPQDKVYNWPNPVYGSSTNIRYYLNATASSVQIKIMDLSGELVTTLNGPAHIGFDNEVSWDVSNVQSGIYIAVLQPQSGYCTETATIKIAVVK
jgi:hypothetical protein